MAVYITTVSAYGNCVTKVDNTFLNKKPTGDKNQLWTVERREGFENQIAFRSNADGMYLRATTGNAYAPLITGEKQWWLTEEGQAIGSYWLKCCDFPDAYLANASGSTAENNKIYMWPKQAVWTHALTFYLQNAKAPGFLSQAGQGDGEKAAEAAKMVEEVKQREAAVADKEAQVRKTAALSEETEKRAKELDEKEKQLAAREEEYKARNKALEEREKVPASNGTSQSGKADAEATRVESEKLSKQQMQMSDKLAELEAREKQVAAKEKQLVKRDEGSNGNAPANDNELAKRNEQLKAELEAAKKELAGGRKNVFSIKKTNNGRVPPPRNIRPAQNLPKTWNPELLKRFEAGRRAMKS